MTQTAGDSLHLSPEAATPTSIILMHGTAAVNCTMDMSTTSFTSGPAAGSMQYLSVLSDHIFPPYATLCLDLPYKRAACEWLENALSWLSEAAIMSPSCTIEPVAVSSSGGWSAPTSSTLSMSSSLEVISRSARARDLADRRKPARFLMNRAYLKLT